MEKQLHKFKHKYFILIEQDFYLFVRFIFPWVFFWLLLLFVCL